MKRIARFEKVSFEQFVKDSGIENREIYEGIEMPERATRGSAGYDFHIPFDLELKTGETCRVSTGIRVRIDEGWVLQIVPRSSLGFKYRLQLDNTVGIIDADYYHALNEGHIMIKITNNGGKDLSLKKGDRFAQGIFMAFGITEDDEVSKERTGGFGSTDK